MKKLDAVEKLGLVSAVRGDVMSGFFDLGAVEHLAHPQVRKVPSEILETRRCLQPCHPEAEQLWRLGEHVGRQHSVHDLLAQTRLSGKKNGN